MLAELTDIADSQLQRTEALRAQLTDNRTIGEAIGLLMGTYQIGDVAATAMIAKLALDGETTEVEIARGIIASHSTG
jgi:AmiR/NasT family two-component response regulator